MIDRIIYNKGFFSIVLIVAILLVFFPTFFNGFQMEWDDQWQLLNNPYVLDDSFTSFMHELQNFYHGQYSPVNTLFYIAIKKIAGFDSFSYHLFCLLIHIFNTLLIYQFIKKILLILKPGYTENRIRIYSFFVALLFAIHPLQVESVAWISASKVILYALFFLLALIVYIKYLETKKYIYLLLVGIFYLLSFGSKEQAIILPLHLMLLDFFYMRYSKSVKYSKSSLRKELLLKIPFFLLALGLWYFSANQGIGQINGDQIFSFYQRILMSASSLSEYVFRFILPVKLYYFYFYPIEYGESLPFYYWGYLIVAAIVCYFFIWNFKRKNVVVVFGGLFFLINLLLVLHILPMPRQMITADRYMYLSIAGLALILIWIVDYAIKKFEQRSIILAISGLYICYLGFFTFQRTKDWESSERVKKNIMEIIEKRKKENKSIPEKLLEKEE